MRHSYYGDLQGSFEGRGWEFFKRGWWLVAVGARHVCGVVPHCSACASCSATDRRSSCSVCGSVVPLVPFIYGAFKAIEWRWWLSGIRFGDVRFESALPRTALIGLYWKVIGWCTAAGRCCSPAISLGCDGLDREREPRADGEVLRAGQSAGKHSDAGRLMAVGYLALILAMNVVLRVYLLRDVWARVVASMTVYQHRGGRQCCRQGRTGQCARRRLCRRPRCRRVLAL